MSTQMDKDELIAILQSNYDGDDVPIEVNDEYWTLADLFIRQRLNNMGDGFGMVNVEEMFNLLSEHKQLLIDNNMLSKDGYNNSGFQLWKNHDIHWLFNVEFPLHVVYPVDSQIDMAKPVMEREEE